MPNTITNPLALQYINYKQIMSKVSSNGKLKIIRKD